jgi:hypothetical protein
MDCWKAFFFMCEYLTTFWPTGDKEGPTARTSRLGITIHRGPKKGFLKKDERSAINKNLAHLTRSRQDNEVDQRWRSTGALDAEGNWHRSELAERALAASTRFVQTLDPSTKALFYPALTEAWKYHLSAFEVTGDVRSPQSEINAMVVDNRVTVWIGTGHIVVQDTDAHP